MHAALFVLVVCVWAGRLGRKQGGGLGRFGLAGTLVADRAATGPWR
jgi:hypothetical protein